MSYLSVNVKASMGRGVRRNGNGGGAAARRNLVNKLNNIFYGEKTNKLCGNELKSLVRGRKMEYDWVENKYNSMLLIVYDKEWKVDDRRWNDMADFLNELYVGDQIREKIIDIKSDSTFVIDLDVYPFFDGLQDMNE